MNIEIHGNKAKITTKSSRQLNKLMKFSNERKLQHSIIVNKGILYNTYIVYLYSAKNYYLDLVLLACNKLAK